MKRQTAIVFDADACIGCRACRAACALAHGDPPGVSRIKTYTVGPAGTFPHLSMYFVSVACQQCGDPECANVCPAGACSKTEEDGTVRIDQDRCIGCGACAGACPYGAVDFAGGRPYKCDLCAGAAPACVSVCPAEALRVMDVTEFSGECAHALEDPRGVRPFGRFILRGAEWKGGVLREKRGEGRRDG